MGRGGGGVGGGVGGVFAPWHWTCLFQEGNKKGETETKRDRAINITQAAECRAKEALKGVGTQTERGRNGGIFMEKETLRFCMLLYSLGAFCSYASKEGEWRKGNDRK